MEEGIINPKICPKCGNERYFVRPSGWGTEGRWVCLKCGSEEKENRQ